MEQHCDGYSTNTGSKPEGPEGEDLLGRTAENLGALGVTHQHLDYFRFGCVQWPTVPSARSSTTGNGAAVGSLCRPVSSLTP